MHMHNINIQFSYSQYCIHIHTTYMFVYDAYIIYEHGTYIHTFHTYMYMYMACVYTRTHMYIILCCMYLLQSNIH